MSVGENIRRLRLAAELSQVQLAERVGVSGPMICQLERGTKVPSLPLSAEIARVLGCGVAELLAGPGTEDSIQQEVSHKPD